MTVRLATESAAMRRIVAAHVSETAMDALVDVANSRPAPAVRRGPDPD